MLYCRTAGNIGIISNAVHAKTVFICRSNTCYMSWMHKLSPCQWNLRTFQAIKHYAAAGFTTKFSVAEINNTYISNTYRYAFAGVSLRISTSSINQIKRP